MNGISKGITGWFIWTIGAIVYAHLSTNTPEATIGIGPSAIEFIYGAMMAAYFIGVPVLTVFWITEGNNCENR